MKYLSILTTAAAGGVLLAFLLFFYVCHKLRVSPWFFPKYWFYTTVATVVIGIGMEVWLWRKYERVENVTNDQRDA